MIGILEIGPIMALSELIGIDKVPTIYQFPVPIPIMLDCH